MDSRRMLDRHLSAPAPHPCAAEDLPIRLRLILQYPCRYSLVAKALKARLSFNISDEQLTYTLLHGTRRLADRLRSRQG